MLKEVLWWAFDQVLREVLWWAFDQVLKDVLWWALSKLKVEKELVKILQSIYKNAQSRVRVNGTFSVDFLLQVGLHQGSMIYNSIIYEIRS